MDHFVYVPKKATANPQDIPFFLSTRLEADDAPDEAKDVLLLDLPGDPIQHLAAFERNAAKLASEFEESIVRF
jgi:hypothetical protein